MNVFMYCYGLNVSPPTPQNTYVKITPKVMVLGGGAFGKCLGHEGRYLIYKWCPRICLPVQETQETWVQSLGQKDPLVEEMTTQYSCLGNSMDRVAWWAIVHGITKNWAPLSNWARPHTHTHTHTHEVQNSSLVTFFLLRIHQEVCNPEEGTRHVCTLIADIQPPELWEINPH